MKKTVIVWGLTLLISACSDSGSGGGNPENLTAPAGQDMKSCEFAVTEGSPADFSVITLNKRTIIKGAFDKEFNSALFEGIAQANVLSSIAYVNKTDAHVYKAAPAPAKGCSSPLFESAQPIANDLNRILTEGEDPTGGSIILGLYLPKNSKGLPSTIYEAAIIVRENSNRWTLVHEFMHHLFELRTVENGVDVEAIRVQLMADIDALDKIEESSLNTIPGLEKASDLVARIAENSDVMYLHFTLEEVTIEKYLKEQMASGVLKYAPKNSNWYIQSSGKKVVAGNNNLLSMTEYLQKEASAKGLKPQANRLGAISRVMRDRNSEIAGILALYPDSRASIEAPAALRSDSNSEVHGDCSHAHGMDEIQDLIINL